MSQLLSRYRLEEIAAQHRQAVRIAAPAQTIDVVQDMQRYEQTKGGDPRELRGIPVIGHGVGGAIPGSLPHSIR
jgi:hypothetical protein